MDEAPVENIYYHSLERKFGSALARGEMWWLLPKQGGLWKDYKDVRGIEAIKERRMSLLQLLWV